MFAPRIQSGSVLLRPQEKINFSGSLYAWGDNNTVAGVGVRNLKQQLITTFTGSLNTTNVYSNLQNQKNFSGKITSGSSITQTIPCTITTGAAGNSYVKTYADFSVRTRNNDALVFNKSIVFSANVVSGACTVLKVSENNFFPDLSLGDLQVEASGSSFNLIMSTNTGSYYNYTLITSRTQIHDQNYPQSVPNLIAWFAASSGSLTYTGSNVTRWDSIVNNIYMEQTGSTRQPIFNGNSVQFDGSEDYMYALDLAGNEPLFNVASGSSKITIFAVLKVDSSSVGTDNIICWGEKGNTSELTELMTNNPGKLIYRTDTTTGTNAITATTNVRDDTFHVHTVVANGPGTSEWKINLDGVEEIAQNKTLKQQTIDIDRCWFGRNMYAAASLYFSGHIAAILIYNRNLNETEIAGVENYLTEQYAHIL
jgi:hypothetical protein